MATTTTQYKAALRVAEAELANHDKRREALKAVVDGLKLLPSGGPATATRKKPGPKPKRKRARRKSAGAGHPEVRRFHYRGLGPTKAYRKFVAEFGDSYTVPQIRDALVQGGVKAASTGSLLTGLHAARRRDAAKAAKLKKAATQAKRAATLKAKREAKAKADAAASSE